MSDEGEETAESVGESTDSVPSRLADDQFYRAFASAQRRRLLSLLLGETESTVDELAAALVGWDVAEGGTMATPDDHKTTVVRLVHSHLPLLDDAGLVSYDSDSGSVRIEDVDPSIRGLIRRSVEAERSTSP